MELHSPLTLEMLGKPFLLEKRIVLLRAIAEHGSISKAAKVVPMSYKSAWDAVDVMNSLSPEPIVCREAGGKDGGGTTITKYGETLLEQYALLKEEHTRFIERLSKVTDIQNGTFQTIERLALQLSARNQIQAQVTSIVSHGVNAKIGLAFKSGQHVYSTITQEAVDNLALEVGQYVIAIFKSTAVQVAFKASTSNVNVLEGDIVTIEEDSDNIKMVLDIGAHDKIVTMMSRSVVKDQTVAVGQKIELEIKSSDIMLGK